jgi:hypothetical protein
MGSIIMEILQGDVDGDRLSVAEYASAKGVSTRSVKRWLADDQLPGAEKDPFTGEWRIPRHAVRQLQATSAEQAKPGDHSEVSRALLAGLGNGAEILPWGAPPAPAPEPTLRERLDDETGYLSIEEAAEYLGIPQAQIRGNAERFGLEPVGTNGSMRVPQRIIRRVMGV